MRRVALGALGVLAACAAVSTLAAWETMPAVCAGLADCLMRSHVHWDSGWYQAIATQGYWYHPGVQSPVAFFPLYPLLLRGLGWLGLEIRVAGVLTSAVAGLGGVLLFFEWARVGAGEETARRAAWLLMLYPPAIFLYGIMYSDALFLLLAVGAFLSLERDRPWLATLLGALATATRPLAPALVLGLLARRLEWRRDRGEPWRWVDALPLLAASGFILYMAYLYRAFGDPLAFVHVQSAPGWDQPPGWQSAFKVAWFRALRAHPPFTEVLRLVGHATAALGLLALVPATYRRVSPAYALYLLAAVGLASVGSKDFMGVGRYGLAAFPAFLTLARLMEGRPAWWRGWVAVSGALLLAMAFGFGAGGYLT